MHYIDMSWDVLFIAEFDSEYDEFEEDLKVELLAHLEVVRKFGPTLGRPHVDTLKGSRHSNMKELRFSFEGGAWRFAFAFDPERNAIFLVGGDKAGLNQTTFYKQLIEKADARFDRHLTAIAEKKRQDNVKDFRRKT